MHAERDHAGMRQDAASRRVASMPFNSGIATSMTTMSGRSSSASCDGLAAVAGFADDLHVGLRAEDHLEALADHRVIVSQQDSDAFHCGSGLALQLEHPRPGASGSSASPPALRARARMPISPRPRLAGDGVSGEPAPSSWMAEPDIAAVRRQA